MRSPPLYSQLVCSRYCINTRADAPRPRPTVTRTCIHVARDPRISAKNAKDARPQAARPRSTDCVRETQTERSGLVVSRHEPLTRLLLPRHGCTLRGRRQLRSGRDGCGGGAATVAAPPARLAAEESARPPCRGGAAGELGTGADLAAVLRSSPPRPRPALTPPEGRADDMRATTSRDHFGCNHQARHHRLTSESQPGPTVLRQHGGAESFARVGVGPFLA